MHTCTHTYIHACMHSLIRPDAADRLVHCGRCYGDCNRDATGITSTHVTVGGDCRSWQESQLAVSVPTGRQQQLVCLHTGGQQQLVCLHTGRQQQHPISTATRDPL
eukprot:GHVU01198129.1.p1 GENE.GHVU01198129.1~~GHVU01198129.1.p1  ORF type:complete len:106 (+),score=4.66 GHVU01198129.1:261-578(+)